MDYKNNKIMMFNRYFKQAFSLVELMVTLIVISCIMAALVASITKKLRTQGITVGGSIGGGGSSSGGSGGSSSNYDPNLTMDCEDNFGANCELCYTNACIDCTLVCPEGNFKNVSKCECMDCASMYGEFCADCDTNACKHCTGGHGLTSGGGCTSTVCPDGQYTEDGKTLCKTCEVGYYCTGGTKYICESDEYSSPDFTTCIKCSTAIANCVKCSNASSCKSCEPGFSLQDGSCVLSMETVEYTQKGTYALKVPDGVTKMKVTLVSGGAGGAAGNLVAMTETFVVSGTGNSANNATNLVHTSSTGLHTWNIPVAIRGTNVLVSACGGGGGGGDASAGARGGIINNVSVPMPDKATIGIIIGGGGGGANKNGSCAYGGGGGRWCEDCTPRTSCGASDGWGRGWSWTTASKGGYDPIFSQHGTGGGSGHRRGAKGSRVGGGGGGSGDYLAGGGGGATLFKDNTLALKQAYVAPGGGGGAGWSGESGGYRYGGGGGGGGVGGGAGATGSVNAVAGTGNGTNVFGSTYCGGGAANTTGERGAMRIAYIDRNGGTGGGAGHMVVNQEIDVLPNDTLTIIVGRGGKGGTAGVGNSSTMKVTTASTDGESANDEMLSKVLNGKGVVLLTSAPNIQTMGTSGGNVDGTTAGEKGYISDGLSAADLGATDGYSNNSGGVANGLVGGAGGQTYLGDDSVLHCVARSGGEDKVAAENPNEEEYGGCGGAGGGAGANGGDGAQGYVKITIIKD